MTEIICGYPGDRDEALVAYLYDDIDSGRIARAFDAHLATCARCRDELAALARRARASWRAGRRPSRRVRPSRIGRQPPSARTLVARDSRLGAGRRGAPVPRRRGRHREPRRPLRPRRPDGAHRLVERRSRRRPPAAVAPRRADRGRAPWRADLTALEQQLRTELRATQSRPRRRGRRRRAPASRRRRRPAAPRARARRRERAPPAARAGAARRRGDARRRRAASGRSREDRSAASASCQNNTGVEVMTQRQLLNYLVRVSQKQ